MQCRMRLSDEQCELLREHFPEENIHYGRTRGLFGERLVPQRCRSMLVTSSQRYAPILNHRSSNMFASDPFLMDAETSTSRQTALIPGCLLIAMSPNLSHVCMHDSLCYLSTNKNKAAHRSCWCALLVRATLIFI